MGAFWMPQLQELTPTGLPSGCASPADSSLPPPACLPRKRQPMLPPGGNLEVGKGASWAPELAALFFLVQTRDRVSEVGGSDLVLEH